MMTTTVSVSIADIYFKKESLYTWIVYVQHASLEGAHACSEVYNTFDVINGESWSTQFKSVEFLFLQL